jgi:hypothetical protein
LAQIATLNKLEGEVGDLAVNPLVVDSYEARVRDACGRTGFAAKPSDEGLPRRSLSEMWVHDLERDHTVQPPVSGAVDCRHTSSGHPTAHQIAAIDKLADQRVVYSSSHREQFRGDIT